MHEQSKKKTSMIKEKENMKEFLKTVMIEYLKK